MYIHSHDSSNKTPSEMQCIFFPFSHFISFPYSAILEWPGNEAMCHVAATQVKVHNNRSSGLLVLPGQEKAVEKKKKNDAMQ